VNLSFALIHEIQGLVRAIQEESAPSRAGPIVVSGMLAEQLARELGAGAAPGAVVVGDSTRGVAAEVWVHVMAGEPTADDQARVASGDRSGVPVVLVQLWPQAQWTAPFVLTPFVVECRAGEGFPVEEIGRKIVAASEHWTDLARRIPVLHDVVSDRLVRTSVVRAALAGAASGRLGANRPVLTLEQVRTVARLRALQADARSEELPVVAGAAGAAVVLGFLLRGAARRASATLPAPLVNAGIAASATWALAQGARRVSLFAR